STALAHVVDGHAAAARDAMAAGSQGSADLDAIVRHAAMESLVSLISDDGAGASRTARQGIEVAETQGAAHWERWLRLIGAVADGDADGFRRAVLSLVANAKLSTLALADVVSMGLGLLDEVPSDLVESMRTWPSRWLPALRRVLQATDRNAALKAAELLASF